MYSKKTRPYRRPRRARRPARASAVSQPASNPPASFTCIALAALATPAAPAGAPRNVPVGWPEMPPPPSASLTLAVAALLRPPPFSQPTRHATTVAATAITSASLTIHCRFQSAVEPSLFVRCGLGDGHAAPRSLGGPGC